MVPQTQITEVRPEVDYVVGHQCGDTYTGPSGGYNFTAGQIDPFEVVPGWRLLRNGLANITHFWEVREGHELQWVDGVWVYVLAPKPEVEPVPTVEAPPPPPAAAPKTPAPKKRAKKKAAPKKKAGGK